MNDGFDSAKKLDSSANCCPPISELADGANHIGDKMSIHDGEKGLKTSLVSLSSRRKDWVPAQSQGARGPRDTIHPQLQRPLTTKLVSQDTHQELDLVHVCKKQRIHFTFCYLPHQLQRGEGVSKEREEGERRHQQRNLD